MYLSSSISHSVSLLPKKRSNSLALRCSTNGGNISSEKDTPIKLKFSVFPIVMDIDKVREILPHMFSFLLVDRVIEYTSGVSAVAIKNVTINDKFFPGHFPDRPIMPGVLMIEFVAKKRNKRLSDLGATTITEKGLGYYQLPSGYEGTLDPWMLSLWSTLYHINPKYFPKSPDVMIPHDEVIDQPKYRILYHKREKMEHGLLVESDIIRRARGMSPGIIQRQK